MGKPVDAQAGRIIRISLLPLLLLAVLTPACEENNEDTPAQYYLNIVRGNNQRERTGAQLPNPLVVRANGLTGDPVPGIAVHFSTEDSAASVTPVQDITDSRGLTSCRFTLGAKPGQQHVSATSANDSTAFTATAEEPGCDEESLTPVDDWNPDHIYITTTSSSLIGPDKTSVLIEFDPSAKSASKVLDTDEELIDLAFSARGELFVATDSEIFKVDPQTFQLESYISLPGEREIEMEGNPGGVLLCMDSNIMFTAFCPSEDLDDVTLPSGTIRYENLAVNHNTRDAYYMHSTTTYAEIRKMSWDGRQLSTSSFESREGFNLSKSLPRGMAVDSIGNVYISIDGNGSQREIRKFDPDDNTVSNLFDFYDYYGGNNTNAGRWGDLTICNGVIYIIDRRNDRIAYISLQGDHLDDMDSPEFSYPGFEGERYGIASIH